MGDRAGDCVSSCSCPALFPHLHPLLLLLRLLLSSLPLFPSSLFSPTAATDSTLCQTHPPPSRSHVDRKRQGALRRPAPGPAPQRSSPSSQARRGRRIPAFFFSSTRQRQHIRTPLRRTRSSSRRSFASFAPLDFDLLRYAAAIRGRSPSTRFPAGVLCRPAAPAPNSVDLLFSSQSAIDLLRPLRAFLLSAHPASSSWRVSTSPLTRSQAG